MHDIINLAGGGTVRTRMARMMGRVITTSTTSGRMMRQMFTMYTWG